MCLCPWVVPAQTWQPSHEMGQRIHVKLARPLASVALSLPRCELCPSVGKKKLCTMGAVLSLEIGRRVWL